MAPYKLTADPNVVIRTADNATIPAGHRWWDDYEAWLAAGNTPDPALTLGQAQAAQEALLQAACQQAITGGFTSSALGSSHQYPSQLTDQQNLMANLAASQGAAAGWTVGIWCAASGAWSLQPHTAAELAQVNADWVASRSALQQHYASLVIKVQAATTVAAVQAITWS